MDDDDGGDDGVSLSGVVLAGGYSTRFGDREKAIADLAGRPMIGHVVDRIEPVVEDIVINCRADQRAVLEDALVESSVDSDALTYAVDPIPDQGPLAGIKTGLEATEQPYGAVVACDMPFCSPAIFSELATRAVNRDGAVLRLSDGWYQTTHAVYRSAAMAKACAAVLGDGGGRILRAIEAIDCVVLEESDLTGISPSTLSWAFESVDTPAGLRAAEQHLEDE